ncbi:MAG: GntR family transcriptional regulator [Phreatobacter sp.]|uniref:GntR family transcriptional regulator n=1 Tax=Phreatobacter sp. TaxID=1966341 RepID=UPI001A61ECF9|nr:GntR family transcriptional regulator [Phreatobacter sp.]MBL8571346.1 GntR family transcriptional regulator [Phreatobacter sp.]
MRDAASSSGTVGEATYQLIRSAIVFGRLAPGQRLRLDRLRAEYGTSVSTLREILNRLTSEGLVSAEGQKGFAVAPVSLAELSELAEMRLLLEQHALELSFAAGDLEWEGRVVAAHHKLARMERVLLAGKPADAADWKRYDWEFHHSLISACGSPELLEIHAGVYDKYLRYQMVVGIFRGEIATVEHSELLACALERRLDRAKLVLDTHVRACVEAIAERQALPERRLAA